MAKQVRSVVHNGVKRLDERMGAIVPALSTHETLTDDEALTRYALLHRGNPRAIADFAAKNAPRGTNPLQAAHDYEKEMERKFQEATN